MRIGIDFDNTIICYDQVFCDLAKSLNLVNSNFQGNKRELRDNLRLLPEGELTWQRMQGKVYGELISQATIFPGFKEFITTCHRYPHVEVFIVSHKTEFGHFDEKHINLRDAARKWLKDQGFSNSDINIPETNVFFETTREEKIERIRNLQCSHFIDDLVEVLSSPLFPATVERFLFQSQDEFETIHTIRYYSSWIAIKDALFT